MMGIEHCGKVASWPLFVMEENYLDITWNIVIGFVKKNLIKCFLGD